LDSVPNTTSSMHPGRDLAPLCPGGIGLPAGSSRSMAVDSPGPPGLASVPLRNAPLSTVQSQRPMVTVSAGPLVYATKPLAPVGSLSGGQGCHLGNSGSSYLSHRHPMSSGDGLVDKVPLRSVLRGSGIHRTNRGHSQVLRDGFPSNTGPVPEHLRGEFHHIRSKISKLFSCFQSNL